MTAQPGTNRRVLKLSVIRTSFPPPRAPAPALRCVVYFTLVVDLVLVRSSDPPMSLASWFTSTGLILLMANIFLWLRTSSRPSQPQGRFLYYPESGPGRVISLCMMAAVAVSALASILAPEFAIAALLPHFASPYTLFLDVLLLYSMWRRHSERPNQAMQPPLADVRPSFP